MTNSKERSSTEQDLTAEILKKGVAKEETTNEESMEDLTLQDGATGKPQSKELLRYQDVLRDREETSTHNGTDPYDPAVAELRMAPLV
jgi:hypothetical protein